MGKEIMKDETAEGGVVGLSVDVILLATLGVAAVGLVINANYTNWDATSKLLFQTVIVIIIAVAFILLLLKRAGYSVRM